MKWTIRLKGVTIEEERVELRLRAPGESKISAEELAIQLTTDCEVKRRVKAMTWNYYLEKQQKEEILQEWLCRDLECVIVNYSESTNGRGMWRA